MDLLDQHLTVEPGPFDRAVLLQRSNEAEIIWVRLGHLLDRAFFQAVQALQIIVSPNHCVTKSLCHQIHQIIVSLATGLTHLDLVEIERLQIRLLCLKGEHDVLDQIHVTADLTWGLLLGLIRRIPAAARHSASVDCQRDRFRAIELAGLQLGIIGFGRLGSRMAEYGRVFGMSVVACDPYVATPDWVKAMSLDQFMATSDIVSLHVHAKAETANHQYYWCYTRQLD